MCAIAIIAVWTLGILAAGCVDANTHYSPVAIFKKISLCKRSMFWPGEFGSWLSNVGWFIQSSPLIALFSWTACLVPWRRRTMRLISCATTLLLTGWIIFVFNPWFLLVGPRALLAIVNGGDGEWFQDGKLVGGAVALWWWLLVPLCVATASRREPDRHVCQACGYSLLGLPSARCPECGADVSCS